MDLSDAPSHARSDLWLFVPPVLYAWPDFEKKAEHDVAALFLDVAGFTALSERLAAQGPEGAELLDRSIARHFDSLLDVFERFGGLPIKIGGDALTVVFQAQPDLKTAVVRAIACASLVRRMTHDALETSPGTVALGHKIGIGAGRLVSGTVGDPALRTETVFGGTVLEQAVTAEHCAAAGEAWLSEQARALLPDPDWAEAPGRRGFSRLGEIPGEVLELAGAGVEPPRPPPEKIPDELLSRIPSSVVGHARNGAMRLLCRHQTLAAMFASCPELRLDGPEALRVLDAHYRLVQRIVEEHGGFLSEFEAGDKGAKLIILFGAPVALENPSEQAARCAQAIQNAVRELGLVRDHRIGLATGRFYVGRIGCRRLAKYSALADRMNVAARLMTLAGRWQVLAGRDLVERSSHVVHWGPLKLTRLKGKYVPVDVAALKGARRSSVQDRRGQGIIGRRAELQECAHAIDAALRGDRGGLLLVTGEPGVGKTRLLDAVRRQCRDRGVAAVECGRATTSVNPAPFSAWRSLLLRITGAAGDVSPEARAGYFDRWLATLPEELAIHAELLAGVLELDRPLSPALASLPPERLSAMRRRSIAQCTAHACRTHREVLIIDDADRLDESSLSVMAEIAPLIVDRGLLVVAAARSKPGAPGPFQPLSGVSGIQALSLGALSAREADRLVRRRLSVRYVDPELETLLRSRSAGNPLLVESWVDLLRDQGRVRVVSDVAYLVESERGLAMPDRLEGLILSQLERLAPDARLTLGVASVIGPSFRIEEVVAVHPESLTEASVSAQLRMATRAELVRYDRGEADRLFFSRPEVREVIHDSLPFQLRRHLHARRVDALHSASRETQDPELALLLAHHYVYIEEPERQKEAFSSAMYVCRERRDPRGTAYWGKALVTLSDQQRDSQSFLEVAPVLERALRNLTEADERLALLTRWLEAAERHGSPAQLIRALAANARATVRRGDWSETSAIIDRAFSLARGLGDPQLLAETCFNASEVCFEAGEFHRALAAAEEGARWSESVTPHVKCRLLFSLGCALHAAGRPTEAYQAYQQALAVSRSMKSAWDEAILVGNIALELWSMGHPEEGHANILRALELKRPMGDRVEIGLSLLNAGFSFMRLGELTKARSSTEEALRTLRGACHFRGELTAVSNLGEILWLTGDHGGAAELFAEAEALLGRFQHRPQLAELRIRQGELLLSLERYDLARGRFDEALELAPQLGKPELLCNAREGMAEALRARGRLDEAWDYARESIAGFDAAHRDLSFPQRVWWRAACVALELDRSELAVTLLTFARNLLESEQTRLSSYAARNRLVRAFPWNQAILKAGKSLLRSRPAVAESLAVPDRPGIGPGVPDSPFSSSR